MAIEGMLNWFIMYFFFYNREYKVLIKDDVYHALHETDTFCDCHTSLFHNIGVHKILTLLDSSIDTKTFCARLE